MEGSALSAEGIETASKDGIGVLLGDQRKGLLALALPLGIALFIQQINNLVDSLWVSGLGSDHMAAVGIVSPIYVAMVGIGCGLGIGISAAISRYIGKGEPASANRMAGQGLLLTLVISAVLTVILLITAGPMLALFGAGDILPLCLEYAIPIYTGTIFIVLSGVMSGMLRGEGAAKRSMYIQTAGAVANIILDPVLIYVFGMGVAGAAWATVIALAITSVIPFFWYSFKKDTYVRIERKYLKNDRSARGDILSVGLPEMLELSLMSLFNVLLNYFVIICGGTDAVAVFTTGWKVVALGIVPAQAIGGALVSICSAEYGMRRFDAITDAFRYSLRIDLTAMLVIALAIVALSAPIAMLFTTGDGMSYLKGDLREMFIVMAIFLPVFSLVYPCSSLMQGLRKAGQAMINTVFRNILITVLFAAVAFTIADIQWVWAMLIVGEITGGLMMWAHSRTVLRDVLKKENRRLKWDETRVKAVKTNNDENITPSSEATI